MSSLTPYSSQRPRLAPPSLTIRSRAVRGRRRHPDKNITLDIGTPAGRFVHAFAKTIKVSEVVSTTIEVMGLDPNERFDLVHEGEVLDPNRPLVSYHFEDGARLELVATGSGV